MRYEGELEIDPGSLGIGLGLIITFAGMALGLLFGVDVDFEGALLRLGTNTAYGIILDESKPGIFGANPRDDVRENRSQLFASLDGLPSSNILASMQVMGRKGGPETWIHAYAYRFQVPDGRTYEHVSYGVANLYPPGTRVTVEYLPCSPSVSRIAGMKGGTWPLGCVFVWLMPISGLLILTSGIRHKIRKKFRGRKYEDD